MPALTRQELYERAWDRPLPEVAAELGLSPIRLRRLCDRHDIPTPGQGYWRQVRSGGVFRRPPLRSLRPPSEEVLIDGSAPEAARPEPAPPSLHPRLGATRAALAQARADAGGFVSVGGANVVPMAITRASADRALTCLTVLLRAAERRGMRLQIRSKGAALKVGRELVAFRLSERRGTGRLVLYVGSDAHSSLSRVLVETADQTLDRLAPDAVAAFAWHAKQLREARAGRPPSRPAPPDSLADFQAREARRAQFLQMLAALLRERRDLEEVSAYLAEIEIEIEIGDRLRLPDMQVYLRRRLAELAARLSPRAVELSARIAGIDFDEPARAQACAEPPLIEFQVW